MKSGSLNSSSRSRICRLIADCETCSRAPAAVNEPVSAIARSISSCLRSIGLYLTCYVRRATYQLRLPPEGGSRTDSAPLALWHRWHPGTLAPLAPWHPSLNSCRLLVLYRLEERHHRPQLLADLLDAVRLFRLARGVEPRPALAILLDPVLRVGAILDL